MKHITGALLCLACLLITASSDAQQEQNGNMSNESNLDWITAHMNNAGDSTQLYTKLQESLQEFQAEPGNEPLAQTFYLLSVWHNLYGHMD